MDPLRPFPQQDAVAVEVKKPVFLVYGADKLKYLPLSFWVYYGISVRLDHKGRDCELVEVVRQKQGFDPGKMVCYENYRSNGDVFLTVNINFEF